MSRRISRRSPSTAVWIHDADLSPRVFVCALAGVLALTACVHSRAFSNPFLFFDDAQNILENPSIRALTAQDRKSVV